MDGLMTSTLPLQLRRFLKGRNMNRTSTLAAIGLSALLATAPALTAETRATTANPDLLAFHQKHFETPKLVPAGDNINVAFAYSYSNFSFIEAPEGIIAVDTGWYSSAATAALADLRKTTDKPVIAIIYTHLHTDHWAGSQAIAAEGGDDLRVFAPDGWATWLGYRASPMQSVVTERAVAQMGILLPQGQEGTIGNGIGPSPIFGSPSGFVRPTDTVSDRMALNIGGLDIELIPSPGDLNENLMVWVPGTKTLFTGDLLGGTFPYIATARFEIDRDPRNFLQSIALAESMEPDYLVSGHGRVLLGAEDVQDVLSANFDIIQFMVSQLDRMVAKGLTADQVIEQLKLPEVLAAHPDLQLYYHRLDWMIRQMHLKRAGFFGRELDLVKYSEGARAERLVPLLGGAEAVVAEGQKALDAGDARWAASLAQMVLDTDPAQSAAAVLLRSAFMAIAETTDSANERNYILSHLYDSTGDLLMPMARLKIGSAVNLYESAPLARVMGQMPSRFRAEAAGNAAFTIGLAVDGGSPSILRVRNGSMAYLGETGQQPDAVIALPRKVMNALAAGAARWPDMLEKGAMKIIAGEDTAKQFFSLIE